MSQTINRTSLPRTETGNIDAQELIAASVFRDAIVHVRCSRDDAEAALAALQADEGHIGDVDASGTLEVWGDYHCADGTQGWRIHLDYEIADA